MKKRIVFRTDKVLHVFTFGKTRNKKIAPNNEIIVQSFHYDKSQFELIGSKVAFKTFFNSAINNCLDCPFSSRQLSGCYTHKMIQYSGFISQLKAIKTSYPNFTDIPLLDNDLAQIIRDQSINKFVRFGSYGEPVLLPYNLVYNITKVCKNWVGYTHQWKNSLFSEFNTVFMASCHNTLQVIDAYKLGFKSFLASTKEYDKFNTGFVGLVHCPASKEMNYKSNCAKCGLCSGLSGKSKKSIFIHLH